MKKIVLVLSVAFLLFCFLGISNAEPLQVTVFESYYHIWGSGHSIPDGNGNYIYNFSYDQSGSAPIGFDYPNPAPDAHLYAHDYAFEFGISMENHADYGGSNHSAEAKWKFKPMYDVDSMSFGYILRNIYATNALIHIEDMTAGQVVADINPVELYGPSYDILQFTVNHDFVAEHVYSLYLFGFTSEGGDEHTLYLKADMVSVPEPATMLLLASGLVGLAGFRKKFRK